MKGNVWRIKNVKRVSVKPEKKHREIFEIFQKYFMKYFMKYFRAKNFMKFYITSCDTWEKSLNNNRTEQILFSKWSKTIITKNIKYKWRATRRANCPSKLAALNIAFNLILMLTSRVRPPNGGRNAVKQTPGRQIGKVRENECNMHVCVGVG